MSEQIAAIRGYVQDALKGLEGKAIKQMHNKRFMNDYERGKVQGAISAYQHVLVETSPVNARKVPMYAFDAWATDVSENSPLSIGAAMEIYNFCESNDLLNMHNVVSIIIELALAGHNRYDIINILKYEAVRRGKRDRRWKRKK